MNRWQRGSLYRAHKGKGAWHCRYYVMVDGTRKQLSERLAEGELPKKAVMKIFTEFMAKINDERPGQPSTDLTIVKFWDDTYWPFAQANLKPSTIQGYQQTWNQHLKPHFNTTLLAEYRTPQMSNFLTHLAKTYRPRTLKHIKFLASAIFAHAVATGNCESNPIRDSKVLGKTKADGVTESYTLEEIENVISALVDHVDCQLIMALAFFMGLRKGEIAGLQWNDVDERFIHVRRNITKGVGGLHTTTPKTLKSVRAIPIIQPVRGLLKLHRKKNPDGVWLFTSNLTTLSKGTLIPILEKAGCEWKGFHAGRRGLGTTLRALTGNSNAGMNVLGHSDEQVTQQHYEHAMPAEALKGMKLLEQKSLGKVSARISQQ